MHACKDRSNLLPNLRNIVGSSVKLRSIDEQLFTMPISEGKWSVRDIVVHIMMWDKNCVQKTLKNMVDGEQVELEEEADPQSLNERSVEYGRTLTPQEALDQSLYHRSDLISNSAVSRENIRNGESSNKFHGAFDLY